MNPSQRRAFELPSTRRAEQVCGPLGDGSPMADISLARFFPECAVGGFGGPSLVCVRIRFLGRWGSQCPLGRMTIFCERPQH